MKLLPTIHALALAVAMPALAGPVQLTSPDGGITVEGELLSRDGELFRIETAFGPVTVDAGMMRCSGAGCPDPAALVARFSVDGAPDLVFRLLPALLEVFADTSGLDALRKYTDDKAVSWDLREIGSDRLVAVVDVKAVHQPEDVAGIAPGSLHLSRDEVPPPIRQDVIALDALVAAVAPQNPRAMVTLAQLRGLLSGRFDTWARLGGPDLPVTVHVSSRWQARIPQSLGARLASTATVHEDVNRLADSVAASPRALGLLPYSSLGNAVPLVLSGACGLATPATRETIRAEDFPFTQPIFLQRTGADQPRIIRDFIAFSRSPEAQPVIRAAGFVDQAIGRIGFEHQGDRIANAVLSAGDDVETNAQVRDMIGTLLNGERLTLTFRFRDGESDLDAQSAANVQRLADAISSGEFDGQTILFAGFSDAAGPNDGNQRLSERRARAVRRAVAARLTDAVVDLEIAGFGELMPMACDDTPWGAQVNRRVETWVFPSEEAR